jgi:hypothetical protein
MLELCTRMNAWQEYARGGPRGNGGIGLRCEFKDVFVADKMFPSPVFVFWMHPDETDKAPLQRVVNTNAAERTRIA